MKTHPGIRIDKIPVAGWPGLVFALGIVMIGLLASPAVRTLTLISLAGGSIGAVILAFWRKYR
jgi:hypothetical protein